MPHLSFLHHKLCKICNSLKVKSRSFVSCHLKSYIDYADLQGFIIGQSWFITEVTNAESGIRIDPLRQKFQIF